MENDYDNLVTKYNGLVDKYNNLLDAYNDAQSSYETQSGKTSNLEGIIDRAKDAVRDLKKDFDSYQYGWCELYVIERDIKSIENKLDGWL